MLKDNLVRTSVPLLSTLLFHTTACVYPPAREAVEPAAYEPAPEPSETRIVEVSRGDSDAAASEQVARAGRRDAPDPVFFHIGAGYGALGLIDLAPCQDQGLAGYVRMHVTFRGSGRVTRAAVESQVAPSPDALSCIGQQLRLATVPFFEGGEVTLSKTYFVGPAEPGPPVSL
jgi:hypothetical protein